jgi:hypothetical protein
LEKFIDRNVVSTTNITVTVASGTTTPRFARMPDGDAAERTKPAEHAE